MPLIEKANQIASISIGQLRKRAFARGDKRDGKHKDKHRDAESSPSTAYQSDWDVAYSGNSHQSGTILDARSMAKSSRTFASPSALGEANLSKQRNGLAASTGNLADHQPSAQYLVPDDRSEDDVNSSVYESNSLEDSGAVMSASPRFERQLETPDYDDAEASSRTSKTTSGEFEPDLADESRPRRNMNHRLTVPEIRINSMLEQSETNQQYLYSDTLKPVAWNTNSSSSSQGTHSRLEHYPSDSNLAVLGRDKNVSISRTLSFASSLRTDNVLPREGFFWQILLYIRLARALTVRNVNGRINTYVKVKYRGKSFLRTRTIENNRNPVWDEKFFIPITNLNYPMELRVYNRDMFKKDDYIGRAMVYPSTLSFGLDKEFTEQLHDETGRSVPSCSGELNFWMTLSETPETNFHGDRRRPMLKQIKEDRLAAGHLTPMLMRAPSDVSLMSNSVNQQLGRRQWSQNFSQLSRDFSIDIPPEHAITSMDDYEPDLDEWLLPNAAAFNQPHWPLLFYEGTKVSLYTSAIGDKTQFMSIGKLITNRSVRNEIRLESLYNRARLVVNLIRGEELGYPTLTQQTGDGAVSSRSPGPRSKLLSSRGMERAVMGRPITHTDGSIPSYVATLSIGKSSHKSRAVRSYTSPFWHQHFEFRLKLGEKAVLNVEITDYGVAVPAIIFRGHLDFERQVPDWTSCFTLKNNLDGFRGHVILLVTLTGLTSQMESPTGNPSASPNADAERLPVDQPIEISTPLSAGSIAPSKELLSMVESHYSLRQSLRNRKDVGWLFLIVRGARDLSPKDRSGRCDSYCLIRLVNRCVYTSTVYKTNNPVWNQAFVIPISDIYDVLEIVVQEEDKRCADFLGKVCFPVIQIANRRCKWYTLKDKKLTKRARGAILLESYIEYNSIRAALRVAYPRETPWVFTTRRVHLRELIKKYVPDLQHKIDRISPYAAYMKKGHKVFMELYNWENKVYSSLFLVGIWLAILFVQPYMIVGGMMCGLAGCCLLTMDWFKGRARHRPSIPSPPESEEDDYEEYLNTEDFLDDDSDSELDEQEPKRKHSRKKPLKAKLAKAREVLGTLQSVMESVASMFEKIDCLIRWQVPWLTMLFFLFLVFVTLLTYFIPLRYLLIIYTTKRFTRRLRNAKVYDASLFAIISRAPNKLQRANYRELKPKLAHSSSV